MADLETDEQIDAYVNEHGIDALRSMLTNGQLSGRRKDRVEYYLGWHDALAQDKLQAEQNDLILRTAKAAEKQAEEAKRAADAAGKQAKAAERANLIAWVALIVSVIALAVAFLRK